MTPKTTVVMMEILATDGFSCRRMSHLTRRTHHALAFRSTQERASTFSQVMTFPSQHVYRANHVQCLRDAQGGLLQMRSKVRDVNLALEDQLKRSRPYSESEARHQSYPEHGQSACGKGSSSVCAKTDAGWSAGMSEARGLQDITFAESNGECEQTRYSPDQSTACGVCWKLRHGERASAWCIVEGAAHATPTASVVLALAESRGGREQRSNVTARREEPSKPRGQTW